MESFLGDIGHRSSVIEGARAMINLTGAIQTMSPLPSARRVFRWREQLKVRWTTASAVDWSRSTP